MLEGRLTKREVPNQRRIQVECPNVCCEPGFGAGLDRPSAFKWLLSAIRRQLAGKRNEKN